MRPTQSDCAAAVVDIAPQVVRHLRAHIRSQSSPNFTIPQFRVLAYLSRNGEATLSELATSQGVSLPTMSKLVGSLVQRRFIDRAGHGTDRRKLKLQLTPEGAQAFNTIRESTREFVAGRLAALDDAELQNVSQVMQLLQRLFAATDPLKPK
ncbi:MAG: MarR family transcriptional regulator [Chloroflexi bacterium]|nr:MarR family transcriptional regulator [Chloroflexota bacterium]